MRIVCSILICLLFISCSKEGAIWDLERKNSLDVNYSSPCSRLNGESLSNVSTFVDKISPSSAASWVNASAYSGNGFVLSGPCYGGYIEFNINISKKSKITFWTKSVSSGFPNRTPQVTVDSEIIETELINGSTDTNNWMQLEFGMLSLGAHTVRIDFTSVSTYYRYYIDEIELWCQ